MDCLFGYCPPGVCGCAYEDDLTDEERDLMREDDACEETEETKAFYDRVNAAAWEAYAKACEETSAS